MRIALNWWACPAVLALAGCVSTPYQAKLPDMASASCVDDLHAMPRIPLRYFKPDHDNKTGEPYVEFANIAHCLRLGATGSTPLALYQLDSVTPPAELVVSVSLSTGGTFAAAVEILDADFHSLRRYEFQDFVRRGTEYSLHAFLNQGQKPAYVLLLPDRSEAGKSDIALGSESNPVVIPAGPVFFMYWHGSETRSVRQFLEGGRVSVTVKPQASASFGPDN